MTSCAEQQSNDILQVVRKEWFQCHSKIIVDLSYIHIAVILVYYCIGLYVCEDPIQRRKRVCHVLVLYQESYILHELSCFFHVLIVQFNWIYLLKYFTWSLPDELFTHQLPNMQGLQLNSFENNDSEIALVGLFPLYVFKDQSDNLSRVFLEKEKHYGPRL